MRYALLGALFVLAFDTRSAHAQTGGGYTITTSTVDGGGATFSTGGAYSLGGTLGQPDASAPLTGAAYVLSGGFWPGAAGTALRADANGDGVRNVSDVFFLINALFAGGAQPLTLCLADADADQVFDVRDVFFLINFLFAAGPAPQPC
jgi:hypothetical protein